MQKFVQAKVFESPSYNRERDLVILAGDFNQNAAPMNRQQKEYYEAIKVQERYRPILQLFHDEYRSMLNALKHQPDNPSGYTLIDCLRYSEGSGQFSPVTFADVYYDQEGNELPIEPALISDSDSCTKQALDYIFQLVPNSKSDLHQVLSRVPNYTGADGQQLSINSGDDRACSSGSQSNFRVAVEKTKLERLPVDGQVFSFISDHFGISTVIERS